MTAFAQHPFLNTLHLYGRYLGVSLRGQMQYKANFVLQTVGNFLVTGIEFLGVWALFARFGGIKGWALAEVALLYGMVNVAYSITEATARGFDVFANMVKGGDFDRVLLRPRSTVLQLAGQEIQLRRLGRFTQGLVVLVWACSVLGVDFTPAKVLLLLAAIAGGMCMFYGLIVLQATTAFWTTESLEVFNILTYGGVQTAQFPISIYQRWFQRIFLYIIPLAGVNYFPALAILGRPDPLGSPLWLQWASPLFGLVFLLLALQVWKIGVRHYCSTGN